jgi:hypothetical protein
VALAALSNDCRNRQREDLGVLKIMAFVLPLGLDSFAIVARPGEPTPHRGPTLRLSALFVAFEAGIPLLRVRSATLLASTIRSIADRASPHSPASSHASPTVNRRLCTGP